jgi:hypothetical protein
MPLQATSGAASYDSFGGGAAAVPTYIEDVFSTYLYTGNGSTQTITNNIDITGKGALVWLKRRTGGTGYHVLTDTARGAGLNISTNDTIAQYNDGQPTFNNNGFNLINNNPDYNASASTYASWTFRKQPKFFDVVTYTGNGTAGRAISHNLGSVPGFIVVKRLDFTSAWPAIHRGNGTNWQRFWLNLTNAGATPPSANFWGDGTSFVAPTSTNFTVGTDSELNANGSQYVAYLFAHNAGGFGLTGTDNVISCGIFNSTSGGGATLNLGYEPQWILFKRANSSVGGNWWLVDNMRGWSFSATAAVTAESSSAEDPTALLGNPTATGFKFDSGTLAGSASYIYVAIRRGPMKVPTVGTSVFAPVSYSGTSGTNFISSGFTVDAEIVGPRTIVRSWKSAFASRLIGTSKYLISQLTAAEQTDGPSAQFAVSNGVLRNGTGMNSTADTPLLTYMLQRAPSFFDVVCWAGDDAAPRNISHNLTVVPEMMIVKNRTTDGASWVVYHKNLTSALYLLQLETTAAQQSGSNAWRSTAPTASVFTVGNDSWVNQSGSNYVNYLFATCAGVSKVGSYTGTATTKQIDCGFTAGARFVLIKRIDSTGDWYVWDSARGIVSGNDPYLLFNSSAVEVTNTDYVDTYSAGFEISSTAPAAINASGGTFIFLAIA